MLASTLFMNCDKAVMNCEKEKLRAMGYELSAISCSQLIASLRLCASAVIIRLLIKLRSIYNNRT
jgi:hypothetical protein